MADNPADFYHQKTDAELRYFVEHPEFYQPDLVAAARRELLRRGVTPAGAAPAAPEPISYVPVAAPGPGLRTGPLTLGLAAVLLLSGGVFYVVQQKNQPSAAAGAESQPKPKRKGPPRLITVETSAIPNYAGLVTQTVTQQVQQLPAAERRAAATNKEGQALRQYRELAKRFWTAECQTEYLTGRAQAGKTSAVFAQQTLLARQAWQEWNQAAVYGYQFGPVMAAQFQQMQQVASGQQHLLESLPGLLPGRQFLTDKEQVSRTADVQDGLRQLRPASPVTGQPYHAKAITIKM